MMLTCKALGFVNITLLLGQHKVGEKDAGE
jgi:hypothetical protein